MSSRGGLLARSAQGATFLILLQIGSRALTFIVNQILLRYLSPELLGISTQLELYSISVLYFARESIRVALQRQSNDSEKRDGDTTEDTDGKIVVESYAPGRRAQEAVNLSYIAIALGPLLAYFFAILYIRKAETKVLATTYIQESLSLYGVAALLELLIEPCFVVAQQQMLYGVRASAEASATFVRCFLTCGVAVWASRSSREVGVLPFAVGQLSYAILLNVGYYARIWRRASSGGFSLFPRSFESGCVSFSISCPNYILMSTSSSHYILSRFSRPALTLSLNLYAQSGLKHLLTQGDSVLVALFTSLSSQGIYALASNYGSLLARMLFQPIEESSRGVFGRLLSASQAPPSLTPAKPSNTQTEERKTLRQENVIGAQTYLLTLLHLYALLSAFIVTIGPTLAPILLRYVAGKHWSSTSAGEVLSLYCYYIPLLAVNGILEAFVSAVATPAQLRVQSAWMFAFSAGFAASGYLALRVYDLGAPGLVLANGVNMAMRILWSGAFVGNFLKGNGVERGLDVRRCSPTAETMATGAMVIIYLRSLKRKFDGDFKDLAKTGAVALVFGVAL